jgi:hypothetical protein
MVFQLVDIQVWAAVSVYTVPAAPLVYDAPLAPGQALRVPVNRLKSAPEFVTATETRPPPGP